MVNLNAVENLADEKCINHHSVMGPKTLIILINNLQIQVYQIYQHQIEKDILYKLTSLHYGH